MHDLVLVTAASLFAGCIDAIVGGGGLILTPAWRGATGPVSFATRSSWWWAS